MFRLRFTYYIFFVVTTILFAVSCKDMHPLTLPAPQVLPETFCQHIKSQIDSLREVDSAQVELAQSMPAYHLFFQDPLLVQLIDTAMAHNYDLLTAVQTIERARAQYIQAAGLKRPFGAPLISVGGVKYGDFTEEGVGNSSNSKIPSPIIPNFNIGVQASWEVDIWHKFKDNATARGLSVQATQEAQRLMKTMVTTEVAGRYYELVALDYSLKKLRENVAFQENALAIVRIQKASGYVTNLAVQQLNAQLLLSRATIKEVEQNIIVLENILNTLLGRTHKPILRNDTTFQTDALSWTKKLPISTEILLQRPDVRHAEWLLASAKMDVQAARKAFFPRLNLGGFLGFTSFSIPQWFNVTSLASNMLAGLIAPLINRSQLKSLLYENKAMALSNFYQYQKIVVNAYNETQRNYRLLEKITENLRLREQRVEILDDAKRTATDLYMSNYANYLEVMTAQSNYLVAFLEMVSVKQQTFLLSIDLYRTLGGGWK